MVVCWSVHGDDLATGPRKRCALFIMCFREFLPFRGAKRVPVMMFGLRRQLLRQGAVCLGQASPVRVGPLRSTLQIRFGRYALAAAASLSRLKTVRSWGDLNTWEMAWEQFAAQEHPGSVARIYPGFSNRKPCQFLLDIALIMVCKYLVNKEILLAESARQLGRHVVLDRGAETEASSEISCKCSSVRRSGKMPHGMGAQQASCVTKQGPVHVHTKKNACQPAVPNSAPPAVGVFDVVIAMPATEARPSASATRCVRLARQSLPPRICVRVR